MFSKNNFSFKPLLVFVLFFFGLIFCSISLVNHYYFRTYAWDLGLFNNAIYDYSHFRVNDCMLLLPAHEHFKNYLADHFSLFPMLISPLAWILGSYTLLIIQIIAILFGGYGIYKIAALWYPPHIQILAVIYFFSIWGIYTALSFDYHDNVVAAMLVPWFLYYFTTKKFSLSIIFFVLIIICKENMALWLVFICIGLALLNRKDSNYRNISLILSVISLLYFIVVIKFAIPALNTEHGKEYFHFNFNSLGQNFSEAFKTLVTRPVYCIRLLFENNTNDSSLDHIKTDLHFMILLSGGIFLLIRPQFLLMLLPIFAQKLFNDSPGKWGTGWQYSIEFVPILAIAMLFSLRKISRKIAITYVIIFVITLTIYGSSLVMKGYGTPYLAQEQIQFYSKEHWKQNFNVNWIHNKLKQIPGEAIVSAQSPLVPHLAFRQFIYQFPYVDSSSYIVLLNSGNKYPFNDSDFTVKVNELKSSPSWELVTDENKLLIFKKK